MFTAQKYATEVQQIRDTVTCKLGCNLRVVSVVTGQFKTFWSIMCWGVAASQHETAVGWW